MTRDFGACAMRSCVFPLFGTRRATKHIDSENMTPFAYLQNALILAAAFACYWISGTWWGFWLLAFWLSPSGDCKCEKDES